MVAARGIAAVEVTVVSAVSEELEESEASDVTEASPGRSEQLGHHPECSL